MDGQADLRSGEVSNSEASIGRLLDDFVFGPEVGSGCIDPETEQAIGFHELLRQSEICMSLTPHPVLEDLDADHDVVSPPGRQRAQVAVEEAIGSLGEPLP